MLTATIKHNSHKSLLLRIALILSFILCALIITAEAQKNETKKIHPKENLPVWQAYKGVAIGMTVPEVLEKLGLPSSESPDGYFYIFTEAETAQVLFDENKKVRTISVIYAPEFLNPPKFVDVFGKTAVNDAKSDGSVFKMVRYEEAGYWVSYNRMAGDTAMVIIVIQKL